MLVRTDGSIVGTIGGGPLEATIIKECLEVLETRKPRLLGFDSAQLGMACGGGGLVLIDYVDPTRPAVRDLFRELLGLLLRGRKGWLVTVVPDVEDAGPYVRRCLVDSDGSITGEPLSSAETLRALAERGGTYDRIMAAAPARTYVQAVGAQGTAYVFGAGHCGEKLVPVLSMIGFSTVVVDDRADFADRERFSTADQVVVAASFDRVVDTLPLDEDSYVVIVTRGHLHDKNILAQALRTPAGYIGMIGSKTKVAKAFQALQEEGFLPDDLARVHAPIGLSIGGETPEEIAVSIAAQLIQVRAGKNRRIGPVTARSLTRSDAYRSPSRT
jgi:xanthine dehydrogenase accessory factor